MSLSSSSPAPLHLTDIFSVRSCIAHWRGEGEQIAFVPTMGALHAGHISLLHLARKHARRVIASVFVNPLQFAPHEDFASYPRAWEKDWALLREAGVDAIFTPSQKEFYPPDFATHIHISGPARVDLEDHFRPHHFNGVATVVAKLLIGIAPDSLLLGEKDYQQLIVVQQMVRDLYFPVEVIGGVTVREPDGLALSSRNIYLLPEERAKAPLLHSVMLTFMRHISNGMNLGEALRQGRKELIEAGFRIDYFDVRDAKTLERITDKEIEHSNLRLLAAVHLGRTRLIDNIALSSS